MIQESTSLILLTSWKSSTHNWTAVAPGHLLFARGSGLFAVPFDSEHATVTGEPVPVLNGVLANPLHNTALIVLEGDMDAGWRLVSWQGGPAGGAFLDDHTAVDPTGDLDADDDGRPDVHADTD